MKFVSFLLSDHQSSKRRYSIKKTAIMSFLMAYVFLFIFKPFSLGQYSFITQNIIITCYCLIAILSFSIAIIIIHPRKRKKWTYIDDILQVSLTLSITNALGHVFSVKLLNPLLNEVFHRNETFIIPPHFLLKAIVYVWVTGWVFYTLLNFYSLTKLQFKNTLLNKNNNHNTKNLNSITFIGKNKNEHLSLRAKDLLYIKSLGHYVEIVYKNEFNAKIDSKTLRLSMNETEQLVELYPYIIRCHKSYFVNTIYVKSIISNASKYQAVVKHIAILIPISKEKITHIEKALSK